MVFVPRERSELRKGAAGDHFLDAANRRTAAFADDSLQLPMRITVQDLVLNRDCAGNLPPVPTDGEQSVGAFAHAVVHEWSAARHRSKDGPFISVFAFQPTSGPIVQCEM